MKKLLGILVLGLLLISNIAEAKKRTKFVKGKFYEGEINWVKNVIIKLPPGKFELISRFRWSSWGAEVKSTAFINLKGKLINHYIFISEMGSSTKTSQVNQYLHEIQYYNKYDGCYSRGEYTIVKVRKKGAFNNCFRVRHIDIKKEINYPDDPKGNGLSLYLPTMFNTMRESKAWIKKNDIDLSSILLCSIHWFMAPTVGKNLFEVGYCINPELNGASKSKFTAEERSEYHPQNINEYPDKKKYMENFIKLAAQRHRSFEIGIGAKEHHKLDLSEYGVGEIIEETKTTNITSGSVISDEIKELKKLHEEGVLTDDEFEKAKKKVLSQ